MEPSGVNPPHPEPPAAKPGWAPPPGPPATGGWGDQTGWRPPQPPYGQPGYPPQQATWIPPQKQKRFGWGAVFAGFMLGGITATFVVIVGIILIGQAVGPPDSISATHPPAAEGAQVAKVGECLDGSPAEAVVADRSQVIDCDELHGSEVTAVVTLPGEKTTPGEEPLATFVDEACSMAFEDYVGARVLDSELDYSGVAPSSEAWAEGDRRVWCLVDTTILEPGEGSVRGSGR